MAYDMHSVFSYHCTHTPLILPYFISVGKIRDTSASDLPFLDSLLVLSGVNISTSCIWNISDDTACYPHPPKRFKPTSKLYCWYRMIPSICSTSSVSVIMDPNVYSKLINMALSSYRVPWNFGSYFVVWFLCWLGSLLL